MANMSDRLPVIGGQDLEACLEQVLPREGAPKITDRDRSYAVSVELDRIRDILMKQRQTWEQYGPVFWKKKYLCSLAVLQVLDETLQEEFRFRMQQEFKRAMLLGQLQQSEFTAAQWRDIRHMVDETLGYVGFRGVIRRISPYIPLFIKQGIVGILRPAAKSK